MTDRHQQINLFCPTPGLRQPSCKRRYLSARLIAPLMLAMTSALLSACEDRDRSARPPADSASSLADTTVPTEPVSLKLQPGDSCRVDAGGGVPASNSELGMPSRAPDIRGLIAEIGPLSFDSAGRQIRVAARPGTVDGRELIVAVPRMIPVAQRVGHRAAASLLALCQEVSVWVTGPVRESRPPQGDAEAVVIESIRELSRRGGAR
jgi:hypothetical protein